MSGVEEAERKKKSSESKKKKRAPESESDEASTPEVSEETTTPTHVPYDPKAKPAKGILKKEGEEGHHKSAEHIHIASLDDGIHDAEQKKAPKKPMPVEGRAGMIVGGKNKREITRHASTGSAPSPKVTSSISTPTSSTTEDIKKDKSDKKDKEEKKDKKEKKK